MFNQNANIYYKPELFSFYRNLFGFMTSFSLLGSIFTLMFASIDRYNSLSNPLRYRKDKATTKAKYFTIMLHFVSLLLALSPIVLPESGTYSVEAEGILVLPSGSNYRYIICLALLIPIMIMWIFTIGVLINLKRQPKLQDEMTSYHHRSNFKTEKQLSKTLSIMIGVFTVCVLPGFVFLVAPEFVSSAVPQNIKQLAVSHASLLLSIKLAIMMMFASNSLWNAFIYTFRNKQFRKDAVELYYLMTSALRLQNPKKCIVSCLFLHP